MSDMTAEERWKHLAELEKTDRFQELSLQGKDALIFYIMRLEEAAAQAQADADALAEEIVALREDMEKARAEEREAISSDVAANIAGVVGSAILAEREACAVKIATFFDWCEPIGEHVNMKVAQQFAEEGAAAIRARSTD